MLCHMYCHTQVKGPPANSWCLQQHSWCLQQHSWCLIHVHVPVVQQPTCGGPHSLPLQSSTKRQSRSQQQAPPRNLCHVMPVLMPNPSPNDSAAHGSPSSQLALITTATLHKHRRQRLPIVVSSAPNVTHQPAQPDVGSSCPSDIQPVAATAHA